MARKLSLLIDLTEKQLTKWETNIKKPIMAQKGGDTWKAVVKVAQGLPAAVKNPIGNLELMRASKDPKDKLKIPGYQKTLLAQFGAVNLTPVTKYQADHGPGGPKQRTSVLRTASSKAEEAKRVQLCANLVAQAADIGKLVKELATTKDYN